MTIRLHTIGAAWAGKAVEARPPDFKPGYGRVACACGGSVVVKFTGDDEKDIESLIEAFSRDHEPGTHERLPRGAREIMRAVWKFPRRV